MGFEELTVKPNAYSSPRAQRKLLARGDPGKDQVPTGVLFIFLNDEVSMSEQLVNNAGCQPPPFSA